MARVYNKKVRQQVQFERVYGLKISKTVYSRTIGKSKKDYSVNALVKNLLRYNQDKLSKLAADPETWLKRQVENNNITEAKDLWKIIKGATRSRTFQTQDSILKGSLEEIIEQSLAEEEQNKLKQDLEINNYTFSNFHWNSGAQRFEDDKGHWIKIGQVIDGRYSASSVEWSGK